MIGEVKLDKREPVNESINNGKTNDSPDNKTNG
jgi:hypothetical protein